MTEWVGFDFAINMIVSERIPSSQSLALVLTTKREQPSDNAREKHSITDTI